jgi:hypothetical protein
MVCHADADACVTLLHAHVYSFARGRELRRIRQQIGQHLGQALQCMLIGDLQVPEGFLLIQSNAGQRAKKNG